jgi:predicted hotdog family 3-hydroxylacyl-ACP dehydratase
MLEQALERMPHSGPMRLIDRIEAADEDALTCLAKPHAAQHYPLRLDGLLFTTTLVELGAQAAAAHASLFGMGAAHTGLILSISNARFGPELVEAPDPFRIVAKRVRLMDNAASYVFEITQNNEHLVEGEVLLSMIPRET